VFPLELAEALDKLNPRCEGGKPTGFQWLKD
jgi:hypothetical protein